MDQTDDPHALLETLLGEVLREQEGEALAEQVAQAQMLVRRARDGHPHADALLDALLFDTDEDELAAITRASALALSLDSLAGLHRRIRGLRDPGRRGALDEVVSRLLDAGVSPEDLWQAVTGLQVGVVLSPPATAVKRPTLLRKHARILALLARRDRGGLLPREAEVLTEDLRREISAAWETDALHQQRPTPLDDAESALFWVEQSLWDQIPASLRALDQRLEAVTGQPLPLGAVPVRLGTQVEAIPAEIRAVSFLHRQRAAALYLRELRCLHDELSMSAATDELREEVGDAWEPYRALLGEVIERVRLTRDWAAAQAAGEAPPVDDEAVYTDPMSLAAPLLLCDRSLRACGCERIADGRLRDVLRRIAAFGLTLARIDVRQDARRHEAAMAAVCMDLGLGAWSRWTEAERVGFLVRELSSRRPLIPHIFWQPTDDEEPDDGIPAEAREVFEAFAVAARLGPGSLGAVIVSAASRPSDVLLVELFQKEARQRVGAIAPPMRAVPLLETRADLDNAAQILHDLLQVRWYRQRLADAYGGRQEIMLCGAGAASGTGRLAADWALYQAQEALVRVSRQHGVALTLSRGLGDEMDHAAIVAQPPGAISGHIRFSVPGEGLPSRFGAAELAGQTLERYTAAALEATLAPPAPPPEAWRALAQQLAARADRDYRRVLHGDDRFVPYLRAATPEPELSAFSQRRSDSTARLRAVAWGQIRLNLPAWLGTAAALAAREDEALRELAAQWPFFRATLAAIAASLAEADPAIAARYDALLVDDTLRPIGDDLRARLEQARQAVQRVWPHDAPSGGGVPAVALLNRLQASLLVRIRQGADPRLLRALLLTASGIAEGRGNVG